MEPTYYVRHPDETYSVADPQPTRTRTGVEQTEGVVVIDLDKENWKAIQEAASQSNWIPEQYFVNDWVSDVCSFLRGGETDDKLLSAMVVLFNHINGDAKHKDAVKAWHAIKDRLDTLPPHPRKAALRSQEITGGVDARPDNTGLDDGPDLPRHAINAWRNPLIIAAWREGLSTRAVGRIFDVSHDTVATIVKGLSRGNLYKGTDANDLATGYGAEDSLCAICDDHGYIAGGFQNEAVECPQCSRATEDKS